MIEITYRCGHKEKYAATDVPTEPICTVCGTRGVGHVTAPRPRFRGAVQGPCAIEEKKTNGV